MSYLAGCRVGIGEEQVGGEHARFEAVVDPLPVHRVDQARRVADGDPSRTVPPARAHRQPPRARTLEVLADLPRLVDLRPVVVEQLREVEPLEALHRRQRADADVHGPVAGGEHPPVARHRDTVLVAQREARLEVPVVVARRLDVGADRQAERLVGDALGAQHARHLAGRTGRGDDEAGLDLGVAGEDPEHPTGVVEQRLTGGLPADLGARLGGGVDQRLVEPTSRPHRAFGREPSRRRPRQLARLLAGDHAQAVDAVGVVERDLEVVQRGDRTRRQAVAADLVAAVRGGVDHEHACPTPGGLDRGGRTGRSGTDDGDVEALRHDSITPSIIEPRLSPRRVR